MYRGALVEDTASERTGRLSHRPIPIVDAATFVGEEHRHHPAPRFARWALARPSRPRRAPAQQRRKRRWELLHETAHLLEKSAA